MIDWLTTSVAFLLFDVYRYFHIDLARSSGDTLMNYLGSGKMIAEQIVLPLGMLFIYWLSGYYNNPIQRSRLQELYTTLLSAFSNTLLLYLLLLTNDQVQFSSQNYAMLGVLFGLLAVCTYTGRVTMTMRVMRMLKTAKWTFRTIIIGNKEKAREVTKRLESSLSNLGYSVCGYVLTDGSAKEFLGRPVYRMDDLERVCHHEDISQIILALRRAGDTDILSMIGSLFFLNIPIKIAPERTDFLTSGIRLQDIYGEPFVNLSTPNIRESTKNVKRTMDVAVSAIAMIVLAIPCAIVAAMIKRDSRGPVLYRQERLGLHRKPFYIYKFRTMRTDAEANGPQLSSDADPRITPVGKVLRKYRIDELPQFWNVLRGDMSLVGPRPERAHYVNLIVKEAPYYTLVHQVRPGITSWGMVKYGYASDVSQMIERTQYDLLYLSNMSISIDLKILIYTVRTVVLGKGK